MLKQLTVLSLLVSVGLSAPLSTTTESVKGTAEIKMDSPVAQLEKLKQTGSGPVKSEDLASRVEEHATAGIQKTMGHSQYALPAQVVPKEIAQDGDKPGLDGGVPTAAPAGDDLEPTTKVFHGAARLISQASSAQHTPPPPPAVPAAPAHTAHRRSPNDAEFNPESNQNTEHFAPYYALPIIAQDIAQYVFRTGDEIGVTMAVEQLMQQGRMSKEEAIAFLQETKYYIDYLHSHFNGNMKAREDEVRRHILAEHAAQENYQPNQPGPNFQSMPFANNPDNIRAFSGIASFEVGKLNNLPMGAVELKPVDIKYRQVATEFKPMPMEFKQMPVEFKQMPLEFKQMPIEFKQMPVEFKQMPIEFKQIPVEFKQIPVDFKQMPAEFKQMPAEFKQTPIEFKQMPVEFKQMPGEFKQVPAVVDYRQELVKRTQYLDPMMQTNIISTSDYDRDGNVVTEEEYEEMMEKLKAADTLYTEYTLEEIIYQLAKLMFSQSLTRDPREARASIQRFMSFLEMEAERGQLSRNIEKKVLDVMIAALSDAIGDHPESMQPQEPSAMHPPGNRLHQYLESNLGESGMSRAILAAYKDELLKGPMHKLPYNKRI